LGNVFFFLLIKQGSARTTVLMAFYNYWYPYWYTYCCFSGNDTS